MQASLNSLPSPARLHSAVSQSSEAHVAAPESLARGPMPAATPTASAASASPATAAATTPALQRFLDRTTASRSSVFEPKPSFFSPLQRLTQPTEGYLLPPFPAPGAATDPLVRFSVYTTEATVYIVGANAARTAHRVLRVGRFPARLDALPLTQDPAVYSAAEAEALLQVWRRARGGATLAAEGVALLGFVRFYYGYYLHIVTAGRAVAMVGGQHELWRASQTAFVELWSPAAVTDQLLAPPPPALAPLHVPVPATTAPAAAVAASGATPAATAAMTATPASAANSSPKLANASSGYAGVPTVTPPGTASAAVAGAPPVGSAATTASTPASATATAADTAAVAAAAAAAAAAGSGGEEESARPRAPPVFRPAALQALESRCLAAVAGSDLERSWGYWSYTYPLSQALQTVVAHSTEQQARTRTASTSTNAIASASAECAYVAMRPQMTFVWNAHLLRAAAAHLPSDAADANVTNADKHADWVYPHPAGPAPPAAADADAHGHESESSNSGASARKDCSGGACCGAAAHDSDSARPADAIAARALGGCPCAGARRAWALAQRLSRHIDDLGVASALFLPATLAAAENEPAASFAADSDDAAARAAANLPPLPPSAFGYGSGSDYGVAPPLPAAAVAAAVAGSGITGARLDAWGLLRAAHRVASARNAATAAGALSAARCRSSSAGCGVVADAGAFATPGTAAAPIVRLSPSHARGPMRARPWVHGDRAVATAGADALEAARALVGLPPLAPDCCTGDGESAGACDADGCGDGLWSLLQWERALDALVARDLGQPAPAPRAAPRDDGDVPAPLAGSPCALGQCPCVCTYTGVSCACRCGFRADAALQRWFTPLLHGFVEQLTFSVRGRTVTCLLVARRSARFAGTRYKKRGSNDLGDTANEVEVEQVLWTREGGHPTEGQFTSHVQLRASIPLLWTQEANAIVAKPDVTVRSVDPVAVPTRRTVSGLFARYGAPVMALNLIKQNERRPREGVLGDLFADAVETVNANLPPPLALRYLRLDYKQVVRSADVSVMDELALISQWSLLTTGFFHSHPSAAAVLAQPTPAATAGITPDAGTLARAAARAGGRTDVGFVQRGIIRSNCIDSLDRTNVSQFCVGKCALSMQLAALGLATSLHPTDDGGDMLLAFLGLYERLGDAIALQYGGSQMHRQMKRDGKKTVTMAPVLYRSQAQQSMSKPKELYVSLVRHYQNSFQDREKQDSMNLYLGACVPTPYAGHTQVGFALPLGGRLAAAAAAVVAAAVTAAAENAALWSPAGRRRSLLSRADSTLNGSPVVAAMGSLSDSPSARMRRESGASAGSRALAQLSPPSGAPTAPASSSSVTLSMVGAGANPGTLEIVEPSSAAALATEDEVEAALATAAATAPALALVPATNAGALGPSAAVAVTPTVTWLFLTTPAVWELATDLTCHHSLPAAERVGAREAGWELGAPVYDDDSWYTLPLAASELRLPFVPLVMGLAPRSVASLPGPAEAAARVSALVRAPPLPAPTAGSLLRANRLAESGTLLVTRFDDVLAPNATGKAVTVITSAPSTAAPLAAAAMGGAAFTGGFSYSAAVEVDGGCDSTLAPMHAAGALSAATGDSGDAVVVTPMGPASAQFDARGGVSVAVAAASASAAHASTGSQGGAAAAAAAAAAAGAGSSGNGGGGLALYSRKQVAYERTTKAYLGPLGPVAALGFAPPPVTGLGVDISAAPDAPAAGEGFLTITHSPVAANGSKDSSCHVKSVTVASDSSSGKKGKGKAVTVTERVAPVAPAALPLVAPRVGAAAAGKRSARRVEVSTAMPTGIGAFRLPPHHALAFEPDSAPVDAAKGPARRLPPGVSMPPSQSVVVELSGVTLTFAGATAPPPTTVVGLHTHRTVPGAAAAVLSAAPAAELRFDACQRVQAPPAAPAMVYDAGTGAVAGGSLWREAVALADADAAAGTTIMASAATPPSATAVQSAARRFAGMSGDALLVAGAPGGAPTLRRTAPTAGLDNFPHPHETLLSQQPQGQMQQDHFDGAHAQLASAHAGAGATQMGKEYVSVAGLVPLPAGAHAVGVPVSGMRLDLEVTIPAAAAAKVIGGLASTVRDAQDVAAAAAAAGPAGSMQGNAAPQPLLTFSSDSVHAGFGPTGAALSELTVIPFYALQRLAHSHLRDAPAAAVTAWEEQWATAAAGKRASLTVRESNNSSHMTKVLLRANPVLCLDPAAANSLAQAHQLAAAAAASTTGPGALTAFTAAALAAASATSDTMGSQHYDNTPPAHYDPTPAGLATAVTALLSRAINAPVPTPAAAAAAAAAATAADCWGGRHLNPLAPSPYYVPTAPALIDVAATAGSTLSLVGLTPVGVACARIALVRTLPTSVPALTPTSDADSVERARNREAMLAATVAPLSAATGVPLLLATSALPGRRGAAAVPRPERLTATLQSAAITSAVAPLWLPDPADSVAADAAAVAISAATAMQKATPTALMYATRSSFAPSGVGACAGVSLTSTAALRAVVRDTLGLSRGLPPSAGVAHGLAGFFRDEDERGGDDEDANAAAAVTSMWMHQPIPTLVSALSPPSGLGYATTGGASKTYLDIIAPALFPAAAAASSVWSNSVSAAGGAHNGGTGRDSGDNAVPSSLLALSTSSAAAATTVASFLQKAASAATSSVAGTGAQIAATLGFTSSSSASSPIPTSAANPISATQGHAAALFLPLAPQLDTAATLARFAVGDPYAHTRPVPVYGVAGAASAPAMSAVWRTPPLSLALTLGVVRPPSQALGAADADSAVDAAAAESGEDPLAWGSSDMPGLHSLALGDAAAMTAAALSAAGAGAFPSTGGRKAGELLAPQGVGISSESVALVVAAMAGAAVTAADAAAAAATAAKRARALDDAAIDDDADNDSAVDNHADGYGSSSAVFSTTTTSSSSAHSSAPQQRLYYSSNAATAPLHRALPSLPLPALLAAGRAAGAGDAMLPLPITHAPLAAAAAAAHSHYLAATNAPVADLACALPEATRAFPPAGSFASTATAPAGASSAVVVSRDAVRTLASARAAAAAIATTAPHLASMVLQRPTVLPQRSCASAAKSGRVRTFHGDRFSPAACQAPPPPPPALLATSPTLQTAYVPGLNALSAHAAALITRAARAHSSPSAAFLSSTTAPAGAAASVAASSSAGRPGAGALAPALLLLAAAQTAEAATATAAAIDLRRNASRPLDAPPAEPLMQCFSVAFPALADGGRPQCAGDADAGDGLVMPLTAGDAAAAAWGHTGPSADAAWTQLRRMQQHQNQLRRGQQALLHAHREAAFAAAATAAGGEQRAQRMALLVMPAMTAAAAVGRFHLASPAASVAAAALLHGRAPSLSGSAFTAAVAALAPVLAANTAIFTDARLMIAAQITLPPSLRYFAHTWPVGGTSTAAPGLEDSSRILSLLFASPVKRASKMLTSCSPTPLAACSDFAVASPTELLSHYLAPPLPQSSSASALVADPAANGQGSASAAAAATSAVAVAAAAAATASSGDYSQVALTPSAISAAGAGLPSAAAAAASTFAASVAAARALMSVPPPRQGAADAALATAVSTVTPSSGGYVLRHVASKATPVLTDTATTLPTLVWPATVTSALTVAADSELANAMTVSLVTFPPSVPHVAPLHAALLPSATAAADAVAGWGLRLDAASHTNTPGAAAGWSGYGQWVGERASEASLGNNWLYAEKQSRALRRRRATAKAGARNHRVAQCEKRAFQLPSLITLLTLTGYLSQYLTLSAALPRMAASASGHLSLSVLPSSYLRPSAATVTATSAAMGRLQTPAIAAINNVLASAMHKFSVQTALAGKSLLPQPLPLRIVSALAALCSEPAHPVLLAHAAAAHARQRLNGRASATALAAAYRATLTHATLSVLAATGPAGASVGALGLGGDTLWMAPARTKPVVAGCARCGCGIASSRSLPAALPLMQQRPSPFGGIGEGFNIDGARNGTGPIDGSDSIVDLTLALTGDMALGDAPRKREGKCLAGKDAVSHFASLSAKPIRPETKPAANAPCTCSVRKSSLRDSRPLTYYGHIQPSRSLVVPSYALHNGRMTTASGAAAAAAASMSGSSDGESMPGYSAGRSPRAFGVTSASVLATAAPVQTGSGVGPFLVPEDCRSGCGIETLATRTITRALDQFIAPVDGANKKVSDVPVVAPTPVSRACPTVAASAHLFALALPAERLSNVSATAGAVVYRGPAAALPALVPPQALAALAGVSAPTAPAAAVFGRPGPAGAVKSRRLGNKRRRAAKDADPDAVAASARALLPRGASLTTLPVATALASGNIDAAVSVYASASATSAAAAGQGVARAAYVSLFPCTGVAKALRARARDGADVPGGSTAPHMPANSDENDGSASEIEGDLAPLPGSQMKPSGVEFVLPPCYSSSIASALTLSDVPLPAPAAAHVPVPLVWNDMTIDPAPALLAPPPTTVFFPSVAAAAAEKVAVPKDRAALPLRNTAALGRRLCLSQLTPIPAWDNYRDSSDDDDYTGEAKTGDADESCFPPSVAQPAHSEVPVTALTVATAAAAAVEKQPKAMKKAPESPRTQVVRALTAPADFPLNATAATGLPAFSLPVALALAMQAQTPAVVADAAASALVIESPNPSAVASPTFSLQHVGSGAAFSSMQSPAQPSPQTTQTMQLQQQVMNEDVTRPWLTPQMRSASAAIAAAIAMMPADPVRTLVPAPRQRLAPLPALPAATGPGSGWILGTAADAIHTASLLALSAASAADFSSYSYVGRGGARHVVPGSSVDISATMAASVDAVATRELMRSEMVLLSRLYGFTTTSSDLLNATLDDTSAHADAVALTQSVSGAALSATLACGALRRAPVFNLAGLPHALRRLDFATLGVDATLLRLVKGVVTKPNPATSAAAPARLCVDDVAVEDSDASDWEYVDDDGESTPTEQPKTAVSPVQSAIVAAIGAVAAAAEAAAARSASSLAGDPLALFPGLASVGTMQTASLYTGHRPSALRSLASLVATATATVAVMLPPPSGAAVVGSSVTALRHRLRADSANMIAGGLLAPSSLRYELSQGLVSGTLPSVFYHAKLLAPFAPAAAAAAEAASSAAASALNGSTTSSSAVMSTPAAAAAAATAAAAASTSLMIAESVASILQGACAPAALPQLGTGLPLALSHGASAASSAAAPVAGAVAVAWGHSFSSTHTVTVPLQAPPAPHVSLLTEIPAAPFGYPTLFPPAHQIAAAAAAAAATAAATSSQPDGRSSPAPSLSRSGSGALSASARRGSAAGVSSALTLDAMAGTPRGSPMASPRAGGGRGFPAQIPWPLTSSLGGGSGRESPQPGMSPLLMSHPSGGTPPLGTPLAGSPALGSPLSGYMPPLQLQRSRTNSLCGVGSLAAPGSSISSRAVGSFIPPLTLNPALSSSASSNAAAVAAAAAAAGAAAPNPAAARAAAAAAAAATAATVA